MPIGFAVPAIAKTAFGFIGKVPREVWYAVIACLVWTHGCHHGKNVVLDRLESAEKEAKEQAEIAISEADENAAERAADFQKEQEILKEAIGDAKDNDTNALDGIF